MIPPQDRLRSVCVLSSDRGQITINSPSDVDPSTREDLEDALQTSLVKNCPADTWGGCQLSSRPYPILINTNHQSQMEKVNEALVKAITDIVPRWWSDRPARFPERMPLQPLEEKLLRWLDAQGPDVLRPFREVCGSWRPDFLVDEQTDQSNLGAETFRICEINARFCWNGYLMCALGQEALSDIGIYRDGISGAMDPQKILDNLQRLYNPDLPLYLLKADEAGYDIHLYTHYAENVLGQRIRFITPDQLRLIPCQQSLGGYKLCCLASPQLSDDALKPKLLRNEAGESLEEIHQVGLELHQRELLALRYEMLQQISLRCFNDMRTLLFVHDKRLLGIVLEELGPLVERNILLPSEAALLRRGICHTVLPGSAQMARFIKKCWLKPHLKNDYILKAVRGGKGEGIIFGNDVTDESWMARLKDLSTPYLSLQGTTYVVQRRVRQAKYDVFLRENGGMQRLPVVGTYHAIHGEFLGIGIWRCSPGSVCAVSRGGVWMCTVMQMGT